MRSAVAEGDGRGGRRRWIAPAGIAAVVALVAWHPGHADQGSGTPWQGGGSVEEGARRAIAAVARARVDGRTPAHRAGAGPTQPALVVLSIARHGAPASVAHAAGADLDAAIARAAESLRRRMGAPAIRAGALKVDVLVGTEAVRLEDRRPLELSKGLDGLAVPELDQVLLPEELLAQALADGESGLHLRRFRSALRGRGGEVTEESLRRGLDAARLRFDSFAIEANGGTAPLYRGNRHRGDLSPRALLAAARSGGDYLLRHEREGGGFHYAYDPTHDRYETGDNELRQAGTTFALLELHRATGDRRYLEAARRGIEALRRMLRGPRSEDAAADFDALANDDHEAKLGGSALLLLAMAEHQRVSGDRRYLPSARRLARFLLFMQSAEGEFRHKYFYRQPDPRPFVSEYYPGEAIFALARLSHLDPEGPWMDAAHRAAHWLIRVRDRGRATSDLPHDHWLLYGLDELYRSRPDRLYLRHAERIGEAITSRQRLREAEIDRVGAFESLRCTPTTTRIEGLVAMHRLAGLARRDVGPYRAALDRAVAFALRCQLTRESGMYLPRPDRALGAVRESLTAWEVRIDFVQHLMSALLGYRALLR